ncbi:MAG: DUF4157 domain-containing protein [Myxococcota bacterium]
MESNTEQSTPEAIPRIIEPRHEGAAPTTSIETTAPATEGVEARTASMLHGVFGNGIIHTALSQSSADGFTSLVGDSLRAGLAGFEHQQAMGPQSSNQAVQRLMRRAHANPGGSAGAAPGLVEKVLQRGGQPLPAELRARLEKTFGQDLSGVRIHTDGAAAKAAESVQSYAFAVRQHVVFGQGNFRPGTPEGDELIAHEIAHVVQFLENRVGRATGMEDGVPVTSPTDAVEREAEEAGRAFARETSTDSSAETSASHEMPGSVDASSPAVMGSGHMGVGDLGFTEGAAVAAPVAGASAAGASAAGAVDAAAPVSRLVALDPGPAVNLGLDEEEEEEVQTAADEAARRVREEIERHNAQPDQSEAEGVDQHNQQTYQAPEETPDAQQADTAEEEVADEQAAEEEAAAGPAAGEAEAEGEAVDVQPAQEEAPESEEAPAPAEQEQGGAPAPAGGGGGGSAPAPAGGGGGGGGVIELDGMVDYYMETNWDRSDYDEKVGELNLELAGLAGTTLDRLMPAETPAGVRSALNLVSGAGAAGIDAMITGALKAIPGVGSIVHILTGIKDIWTSASTYSELDDSFGMWVNIIRNIADLIGSVVGNIGDLATVVQDIAAISVVGAPLAGLIAFCGEIGDAVGITCDTIKTTCSVISTIHNVVQANEAERNNDFRRAAKYRSLAQGNAINAVVDFIGMVSTLGSMGTANALPGEVGEDIAEAAGNSFRDIAREAMAKGALGIKGDNIGTAREQIKRGKNSWLTGTGSFQNLMYHMGLGDAMAYGPDGLFGGRYIEPSGVSGDGEVARLLSGARQETQQVFDDAWAELDGNNPKWNQKLINDILNPSEGSWLQAYSDALSPTALAGHMAGWTLGMINTADEFTSGAVTEGFLGLARLAEDVMGPGIETIVQWMNEAKDPLEETCLTLADALRQQEVSLQLIRDGIPPVQDFLTQVSTFTEQGEALDGFISNITGTLGGWHMTGERLGIPDYVPAFTYQWALDAFNSMLDGIISSVNDAKNTYLPQLDQFIETWTDWGQEQLKSIEDAVREGGEVEVMLQEAHRTVADGLAQMLESFANWEILGEVNFEEMVQWCVDRAEAYAQAVEDQSYSARLDEFKNYLRGEAQNQVNDWKANYSDDVEQAYSPEVPANELAAVDEAWTLIEARFDELRAEQPDWAANNQRMVWRAQAARNTARAQAGKTGQQAIEAFWGAANEIAEVGSAIGA